MKINIYKLGGYKIIESHTGELTWEAHFGLGAIQEGRCFKKGTILFMGPAENQRDGFLKLEFIDHLKGFPDWLKTKYHCGTLEVFHCKTGKKVSREEMRLWMLDQDREGESMAFSGRPDDDSKDLSSLMSRENVDFRLRRYEIIKKANGQVVWKTYAGPGSLRTGTCIILEDILFMGRWQTEQTNLIERQFRANLKQLPEWNQTKYYCLRLSLHDCKSANRVLEEKKGWRRTRPATAKHDIRNEYKSTTEFKIPKGTQRGIFSARILPIFDSLANPAASRGEHARFFRSKFKKSYISKSIAVFRNSVTGKWITHIVALIFLIISLFFIFLIGYWKERYERRHYKKGEHASSHHRDH